MQDQPIRGVDIPDRCTDEEQRDSAVISLMLHEAWPWSVQEIGREIRDPSEAIDSVRRLTESGLVHQIGDFVFPTRTARRAAEIEIGTA
jgi:hypothetical protein